MPKTKYGKYIINQRKPGMIETDREREPDLLERMMRNTRLPGAVPYSYPGDSSTVP